RVDWRWAMNKGDTIAIGWRPSSGFLRWRYHAFDEAIIIYTLALASPTHPIRQSSYDSCTSSSSWLLHGDRKSVGGGRGV
ncbi:glucoamylase family protein, partial [Rhizobium leguminosarum]|uniref:glucoamylase family protein n=1 Tax=Rhizobium leguminosarum TaxID=384 RepID=UPI003F9CEC9E